MKTIPLTQGYEAIVDDADYERCVRHVWWVQITKPNCIYAVGRLPESGRKLVKMHRFILGLSSSDPMLDHADRNGLNNQRSNLRFCTHRENRVNSNKSSGEYTSNFRGVFRADDGSWFACVYKTGESRSPIRVTCNLESEAALVYNRLAIEHYKEFAVLNSIVISQEPCIILQ